MCRLLACVLDDKGAAAAVRRSLPLQPGASAPQHPESQILKGPPLLLSLRSIASTMLAGEPTPTEGIEAGAAARDAELANVLDAAPVSLPITRRPLAVPAPVPPGGFPAEGWSTNPVLEGATGTPRLALPQGLD